MGGWDLHSRKVVEERESGMNVAVGGRWGWAGGVESVPLSLCADVEKLDK